MMSNLQRSRRNFKNLTGENSKKKLMVSLKIQKWHKIPEYSIVSKKRGSMEWIGVKEGFIEIKITDK